MNDEPKRAPNPTIIFDRSCSVDEMFEALMEQSREYHKEAGTPMPPPHPSDSESHPGPIAPPLAPDAE